MQNLQTSADQFIEGLEPLRTAAKLFSRTRPDQQQIAGAEGWHSFSRRQRDRALDRIAAVAAELAAAGQAFAFDVAAINKVMTDPSGADYESAASVAQAIARRAGAEGGSPAHSADFSSVRWNGTSYTFNHQQSLCVAELWDAWENGTPVLREKTIGEAVHSDSDKFRLENVFRKHPAWGAMIHPAGKGMFELKSPK